MAPGLAGVLAVVGGAAWLIKVALIWGNGGTETTGGVPGLLFMIGFVALTVSSAIRGWHVPAASKMPWRLLMAFTCVVALVAMVDLPILLGWLVLGHTWLAEELGIILTALLALGLGTRWLTCGFATTRTVARPVMRSGP